MRKICSVGLCIAMLWALCTPGLAAFEATEATDVTSGSIQLSDGSNFIVEDLPGGDARFTLIKNGEVIAKTYLDRDQRTLYNWDKQTGEDVQIVEDSASYSVAETELPSVSLNSVPSGFVRKGSITYDYYGGLDHVIGRRSLEIYNKYEYYTGSRYNISGVYQSWTSFVGFIAAVINLPGLIASQVATSVLNVLGIVFSAGQYIIPDHYVRCTETVVSWFGQVSDFPEITATLVGSEYVVTQEGYSAETYYSENYYPYGSFISHNVNLATAIYWAALGYDYIEIVAWN